MLLYWQAFLSNVSYLFGSSSNEFLVITKAEKTNIIDICYEICTKWNSAASITSPHLPAVPEAFPCIPVSSLSFLRTPQLRSALRSPVTFLGFIIIPIAAG